MESEAVATDALFPLILHMMFYSFFSMTTPSALQKFGASDLQAIGGKRKREKEKKNAWRLQKISRLMHIYFGCIMLIRNRFTRESGRYKETAWNLAGSIRPRRHRAAQLTVKQKWTKKMNHRTQITSRNPRPVVRVFEWKLPGWLKKPLLQQTHPSAKSTPPSLCIIPC